MRETPDKSRTALAVGLALVVVILGVFSQVRTFDFIIYDDPTYVIINEQVKAGLTAKGVAWAFTTSRASNWHPLTWLSLMLDCSVFGPDPHRLHLTNLLLHTANSVLLLTVLVKMTRALWRSAFVAAAFALHPLHIQSVAWIAERKDVLCALFWMLTLVCYIRYVERPVAIRYSLTLLVFVLGLMAKPMLVTFPCVLLLLDFWPLGRFQNSKFSVLNLIIEKLPFFLLAAISSAITLIVQQQAGVVKDIVNFPLSIRVANALVSYVTYIMKMFWPTKLSIFYPHPGNTLQVSTVLLCASLLAAVTVYVIWQAGTRRYLLVGWTWFIGTLIPVIGLVQVGDQAMADRYTYIPLIGLFLIIAWGLPDLLAKYTFRKPVLAIAATAVLTVISVSTYLQLGYWQNSVTILEHAIEVTPNDRFAHANLGAAFLRKNMLDQAIVHFEKVLQSDPCDAMTQLNLGAALLRKDKTDQAIVHFEKALQLDPCDVITHLDLGAAFAKQGKQQQAIEHFTEALRIDPCCTEAFNLREQLLRQRQPDQNSMSPKGNN